MDPTGNTVFEGTTRSGGLLIRHLAPNDAPGMLVYINTLSREKPLF